MSVAVKPHLPSLKSSKPKASLTSSPSGARSDSSTPSPQAHAQNGDRRTSFNFLRRAKSNEPGKMLKKGRSVSSGHHQPSVASVPPQLPGHSPLSTIPDFGGDNARPDSYAIIGNAVSLRAANANYPPAEYQTAAARYQVQPAEMHDPRVPSQQQSPTQTYIPSQRMPSSSPGYQPQNGDSTYAYAKAESMAHRGRYSYASSGFSGQVNSPRRVRRRKDPTPFNILVIGEQSSGKTSFIEFLRDALLTKGKNHTPTQPPPQPTPHTDSAFTPHYLEIDKERERIGVTLWDSQGLERKFVDLQLRELSSFLESKFEETFTEEQKVIRAPGVRETHIHCVFLILDPLRLNQNIASTRKSKLSSSLDSPAKLVGVLDEDLDLQVIRALQTKTTVIPIISKADTITSTHMGILKRSVWSSLKQAKIDPLEALNVSDESEEEEEEDDGDVDERDETSPVSRNKNHRETSSNVIDELVDRSSSRGSHYDDAANEGNPNSTPPTSPPKSSADGAKPDRRSISNALEVGPDQLPYLPLSIISPDSHEPGTVGRRFPWGFANPYDEEHCDFVRLKDAVFGEWRGELREASRQIWYEGWRTERLRRRDVTPAKNQTQGRGYGQGFAF